MRFAIQEMSGGRRSRPLLHCLVLFALGWPALAEPVSIKGLNSWVLASLPDNLQQVRDLGVSTVRVDLPWEQVEPMPNQFDWQKVDRVIEAAHAGNIQVLFTLRSISSWGTAVKADPKDLYHHASHPKSMADWERFVRSLAQRYKGQGVHYEIENEVNTDFWSTRVMTAILTTTPWNCPYVAGRPKGWATPWVTLSVTAWPILAITLQPPLCRKILTTTAPK